MKAVRQIARINDTNSITYEIVEATDDELTEFYKQDGCANEWVAANADVVDERLL